MKHVVLAPFSSLFLCALAAAQGADAPLLGRWTGLGPDHERLDFRADGTLAVDGRELRYELDGARLVLRAGGQRLGGTWQVDGVELSIALRGQDGKTRTERYRRDADAEAAVGLQVGRARFALPRGWREARRTGDVVLLDPGLAATDTLDALVFATCGELEAHERDQELTALVRAQLPQLARELAVQRVQIELARASVAAVELPSGPGVELRVPGVAAGARAVTVWVGAMRDATHSALVIAVVLRSREDAFLPGARAMLQSARLAQPDAAAVAAVASDADALAGAEFGRATFGSGASLTTVYTFGGDGSVQRRTMFSSQFNGSDSTRGGVYRLRGDHVSLRIGDDELEGTLEREGGRVVALRVGNARYARQ